MANKDSEKVASDQSKESYADDAKARRVLNVDGSGNAIFSSSADIMLEIAMGNVTNITSVNKFGRNLDIDAATAEDIWDGGGTWTAPTQARTHNIASTSANDTSGGTGARTIRVFGLTSWDTAEVNEDITMNGINNVATANSYVIIHRMRVLTKGSSGPNVGTITATAQTDATVTAQINAMEGQTQMAIYGVPSIQTAYMTKFYCSVNRANTSAVNISLLANPEPDAELTGFLVKHTIGINSQGSTAFDQEYLPYNKFSGPVILKMKGDTSANNSDISAGFDLLLVTN